MGNCEIHEKLSPLAAIFSTDQYILAYFVQGHLVTISAKLFPILTIGYRLDL